MLSMTKSTLILDPTASVHKGPMLPEDKKFDIYRAFHVFVVEILKNDGLEVIKSTVGPRTLVTIVIQQNR